jgi:hypothetical protein
MRSGFNLPPASSSSASKPAVAAAESSTTPLPLGEYRTKVLRGLAEAFVCEEAALQEAESAAPESAEAAWKLDDATPEFEAVWLLTPVSAAEAHQDRDP